MEISSDMLQLSFILSLWMTFAFFSFYGAIRFVIYLFSNKRTTSFPLSFFFIPAFLILLMLTT
jgi:hypothetical protein